MKLKLLVIIMSINFLLGCSASDPKIYEDSLPKLDIKKYLNGPLEAHGILQNRKGKVIKTFTVKMIGTWEGNKGTLEEDFIFSDGTKDRRVWEIEFSDEHNFTAKAHDTVGIAKGEQYGNAMKMDYILKLDVDGTKYDIRLIDWIYLVDEKNAINVSEMTKFGFRVGSLRIAFKKL